jgi:hypothetical protein
VVELEEHLLADGTGIRHLQAVEPGGAIGETALRRGYGDPVADKVERELPRYAMDGMTLWHERS